MSDAPSEEQMWFDNPAVIAGAKVNAMWRDLAQQITDAVPTFVINDDPEKALQWARYAEACWWQATGDSDTNDLKDVLKLRDPE